MQPRRRHPGDRAGRPLRPPHPARRVLPPMDAGAPALDVDKRRRLVDSLWENRVKIVNTSCYKTRSPDAVVRWRNCGLRGFWILF